jgi:hypothetical protein
MSFLARLCDAALPEWPVVDDDARRRGRDAAAAFVRAEIALAPAHIRCGIAVLGTAFHITWMLCGGNVESAVRLAPPLRKYWQLIHQLAVLAYLEHPDILNAIGMENGAARQATFRARRAAAEAGS